MATTTRQRLDDGRWFAIDRAEKVDEGTRWNGNNHISLATGSQWEHEALYRTAGGKWVLNSWSQWQGSSETWEEIEDEAAAAWLVRNEYQDAQIPEALRPLVAEHIAALEVA